MSVCCYTPLLTARLEGDVELEVSYQPHFNTITKTGDANFSKIPHAVAELIDNSIQVKGRGRGWVANQGFCGTRFVRMLLCRRFCPDPSLFVPQHLVALGPPLICSCSCR